MSDVDVVVAKTKYVESEAIHFERWDTTGWPYL